MAEPSVRHRLLPESAKGSQAKVDLANIRKADVASETDWRAEIGRCVGAVRERSGLSLKEFAAALHRDERQVSRWIDGAERAHLDALWAVEAFRLILLVVFAERAGHAVEVLTEIRVSRRSA